MAKPKRIGNYDFTWLTDIVPETENGSVNKNTPASNYANLKNLPLHKYGSGPFCNIKLDIPRGGSCVYAIVTDEEVVYIGSTVDLFARWSATGYGKIAPRNCYQSGQITNCHINNYIYETTLQGKKNELYIYETNDYKKVEKELIKALRPKLNIKNSTIKNSTPPNKNID